MIIEKTYINGVFVISPDVFTDQRGFFYEFFNRDKFFQATGLYPDFIQDNLAKSSKGVLRGLHFQKGKFAQAKLVSVLQGSVQDVVVDLRPGSTTFGKHFSIILSAENKKQLFIPRGFAHGYLSLADETLFFYKIDNVYSKTNEAGIIYNDTDLQINWQLPESELILSDKDQKLPGFKEYLNV